MCHNHTRWPSWAKLRNDETPSYSLAKDADGRGIVQHAQQAVRPSKASRLRKPPVRNDFHRATLLDAIIEAVGWQEARSRVRFARLHFCRLKAHHVDQGHRVIS